MADFKTHLSAGAATGFAISIITYWADWITNVYMAIIVFFVTAIGSFLPDMDSASGLPVRIIFGLYAYFAATLTIYYLHDNGSPIYLTLFLPFASFIFVHKYLRKIFIKFTKHRGIFHSVPAILISFFATLVIAWSTDLKVLEKFVIAISIASGYFCHLLLDEIYSVNVLMSNKKKKKIKLKNFSLKKFIKERFGVKRSFGTALDLGFKQKEKYPGIIAYLILIVLIIISLPIINEIYNKLW